MKTDPIEFFPNSVDHLKWLIGWVLIMLLAIPLTDSFAADDSTQGFQSTGGAQKCPPTPPDLLGPFYEPNAPLRAAVGEGYVLRGRVMSSEDCSPLPQARIEFWMAGPDGIYSNGYRATVLPDEAGVYRFESHRPPSYLSRPPHIHVRVSAEGYQPLITQHYPVAGSSGSDFDLVLVPK
jgi:protocatechuate 3,4-dioxygenase beta subunit